MTRWIGTNDIGIENDRSIDLRWKFELRSDWTREKNKRTCSFWASNSARHGCKALISLKSNFNPLLDARVCSRNSEKVRSLVVWGGWAMIGWFVDGSIRISASININEPKRSKVIVQYRRKRTVIYFAEPLAAWLDYSLHVPMWSVMHHFRYLENNPTYAESIVCQQRSWSLSEIKWTKKHLSSGHQEEASNSFILFRCLTHTQRRKARDRDHCLFKYDATNYLRCEHVLIGRVTMRNDIWRVDSPHFSSWLALLDDHWAECLLMLTVPHVDSHRSIVAYFVKHSLSVLEQMYHQNQLVRANSREDNKNMNDRECDDSYQSNTDIMEKNAVRWYLRKIVDGFGQRSMEFRMVLIQVILQDKHHLSIAEQLSIPLQIQQIRQCIAEWFSQSDVLLNQGEAGTRIDSLPENWRENSVAIVSKQHRDRWESHDCRHLSPLRQWSRR